MCIPSTAGKLVHCAAWQQQLFFFTFGERSSNIVGPTKKAAAATITHVTLPTLYSGLALFYVCNGLLLRSRPSNPWHEGQSRMSIGAAVAAFTLAGLSLAGLDSEAQGQLKAAQWLAAALSAAGPYCRSWQPRLLVLKKKLVYWHGS